MKVSFFRYLTFLECGAFLLGAGALPSRVRAESSDSVAPKEEYRVIIANAVREYDNERWEQAIDLFQKAHAIKANARTLRGMGLAAFEGQRYVDAVRWLTAALDHPTQPLTAEMSADLKAIIARAREFVGFYKLDTDPVHLTIEIDGRPALIEDGKVKVDEGQRRLVATAKGYEPLERNLSVQSGDNGVLGIKLEAERTASTAPKSPVAESKVTENGAESSRTDTSKSKVVPWILVSAGVATAAAGGVFIGLSVKDINAVNGGGYLADLEVTRKRIPLYSRLGFALLGVGVVTTVLGTIILLTSSERANERATRGVLELRAGLGSLSVAGKF